MITLDIRNESIRKTTNSEEISICDIYFNETEYSLHIYEGSKCDYDIRLRYKRTETRMRTPKHMHWLLDLILKKERFPTITDRFVEMLKNKYNDIPALSDVSYEHYCSLVEGLFEEDLQPYSQISNAGEYPVEFVYMIITILIAQEKTNYPEGGLFQDMLTSVQYDNLEVFKLLGSEWWK